jgi:hypothetical protein
VQVKVHKQAMVASPLSMAAKLVLLLGLLHADVVLGYVLVLLNAVSSESWFQSGKGNESLALGIIALRCDGAVPRLTTRLPRSLRL